MQLPRQWEENQGYNQTNTHEPAEDFQPVDEPLLQGHRFGIDRAEHDGRRRRIKEHHQQVHQRFLP